MFGCSFQGTCGPKNLRTLRERGLGEAVGFLQESRADLPQSRTSWDEELGQSLPCLSSLTASELASYGFNNKLPETQGLKTTEMFSLMILAGQGPR